MKTALTVWENRISPVFDSAHMLLVVEIKNEKIISRRHEPFNPERPLRLTDRLHELEVAVLICGAISEMPAKMIDACDIKLIPFIAGNTDEVLEYYAKGLPLIPMFLMPGCDRERRKKARFRQRTKQGE